MTARAKSAGDGEHLSRQRLRLWLKLLEASGLIEEELRRRFRSAFGTTLPRFDVMAALARNPEGLKMSEISEMLRIAGGNTTVIVDKLEATGLALRVAVPGDRRAQRVHLTAKGAAVFDEQARAHESWTNELMADLDADDVEGMSLRLDHLNNSLRKGG